VSASLLTRAGRPSRYGLACGYVDEYAHGVRLTMPSPSAGVLRVTGPGGVLFNGRNLTQAREIARRTAATLARTRKGDATRAKGWRVDGRPAR
jgi:hypothetical protein